jgi:hypothetical protein
MAIETLPARRYTAEQLMGRSAPVRLAFRWARDIYSSMLRRRIELAAAFERKYRRKNRRTTARG